MVLVFGICIAIANGLVPGVAYAFGACRLKRLLWLFIHATWVSTLASCLIAALVIAFPQEIAKIWGDDSVFLHWAKEMIPKVFYTSLFVGFQYTAPALLQSMNLVASSTALNVLTLLLPMPLFSTILYFTGKSDPGRIMWTYALNDT
jgi:Na+-driven multidrug efflux pump